MAQLQFRSDDTIEWGEGFGDGKAGAPSSLSGVINRYGAYNSIDVGNKHYRTVDTFNIGEVILIYQATGANHGVWQLNKIVDKIDISGGYATYVLKYGFVITFGTGSQIVFVPEVTGGSCGNTITGTAWNGSSGGIVAIMSNASVDDKFVLNSSGVIDLRNLGFRYGAGGPNYIDKWGRRAEGHINGNDQAKSQTANNQGGGAGQGDPNAHPSGPVGSGGGGGGNKNAGSNGQSGDDPFRAGYGGTSVGNNELTIFDFPGAGGGGGSDTDPANSPYGGRGGRAPAIFFLFARHFVIEGNIYGMGEAGQQGRPYSGGGGGAAGASGLFKCQTGNFGSNKINFSAGVGGTHMGGGRNGGNGSVGRVHCDYSESITGTTAPTFTSRQDTSLVSVENKTVQAKAAVRFTDRPQTVDAKARIRFGAVTNTITAKARILKLKSPTIQSKSRIKKEISRTIKALAYIVTTSSFETDSQRRTRRVIKEIDIDWKLDGTYTDESDSVLTVELERRIAEPQGGISLAMADVVFENTDDRYTPRA